MIEKNLFSANVDTKLSIDFVEGGITAGFPSPAEDFCGMTLDLNRELIKNPAATFYARVKGSSMIDAGIDDGDLLVIDKSIEAYNKSIAVCYIDGEFTIKRLKIEGEEIYLMPANKNYKPIKVTEFSDFMVWGVVRYCIKKM